MSSHDPLCSWPDQYILKITCPECTMIAKVRADERSRIAQAIEAERRKPPLPGDWSYVTGLTEAAQIARNGGRDE